MRQNTEEDNLPSVVRFGACMRKYVGEISTYG